MRQRQDVGSVVLTGGPVVTMDAHNTVAEAVAIAGGRVVAVGDTDEVLAAAGPGARRVDVDGATVMPGLIDTHPHLIHWAGFKRSVVPLYDATSWDDILAAIRAAAETTPPGEWIRCSPVGEPHYFIRRGWRDLAEGQLPTREVLDAAAPDHPVWIQAWAPISPNITCFNTRGLRKIQISRNSPDRIGRVSIEKDATGEPTGRFMGPVNNYYNNEPWWDSVLARINPIDPMCFVLGAGDGIAEANARGVTTVFEGHMMDWPLIDIYRAMKTSGDLTMRVKCTPDGEPHGLADSVELTYPELGARLQRAFDSQDLTDDLFRVEGFLCTRGGPFHPGMHVWYRHYQGPNGEWTNGLEFLPAEKGEFMVNFAAERGMRLNLITVADREHDIALAQLNAARDKFGDFSDQGWILQHAYFMNDDHCDRFRDLGFDLTTSMSFSYFKVEKFRERIGKDVLKDLIPLQRELNHGFNVGCGTDWGPANIWEHIRFAQTHETVYGGSNNSPDHGVSRADAIAMWTSMAAKVLRWDGIGSLEPGNHADVAIVDRDPLTCSIDDLPQTQTLATLLGGDVVHGAGTVAGLLPG